MKRILSFVSGLVLAAVAVPAGAQTLTTVRVASPVVDITGSLFYALELGYFKNAGLDVQITPLVTGGSVVDAVTGGTADIGSANVISLSQAHERGVPLVLVAPSGGNSVSSPVNAILVAKNSSIKTAADLNGKTVMTSALQNITQIQVAVYMDAHGGDYSTVKWVAAPPPQAAGAVSSGAVDAATITEPYLSDDLAAGNVKLLAYTGADLAPLVIEGGYFCSTSYAQSHVDVVKKFARAVLDAGQWSNTHHAEAAAIMQKYAKSATAGPAGAHFTIFPATFKASDLQPVIDAAAKYGMLKASFPAAQLVLPELR
jgi:NitT/TauT family transport system substrate-binding protein